MATITEVREKTSNGNSGGEATANGKAKGSHASAYSGSEYQQSKEHKWARPAATRENSAMLVGAYMPYIVLLAFTLVFHETPFAERFYTHLNEHYTRFQISFYGSLIVTTGVYWLLGFIFMAFDLIDPLHNWIKRWKVQPDVRPTWVMYREVFTLVIRNLFCVNVPVAFVTSVVNPFRVDVPLPRAWETLWTFFLTLAFEEVGFYCVHRTFHSKRFYASVHKTHHKFTAPVAFSGTYATVIEHFFSNLFPVMLPFYLTNAHFSCAMCFFCSLLMDTTITHSGYNVPYLINALKHDWHHYAFTENFGPIGVMDKVMGTNTRYNAWLGELKRRDADGWLASARLELAEKTQ